MALDSVPSYPGDLGSSTTRASAAAGGGRTQHRIRKEERTWTADTYAPYDDGHQWRKYGEKKLSSSNFPRFYYRCTYKNDMKCPATKQVQQKDTSDPPLFSVTYFNHHTCNTTSRPIGSAPDTTEQPSSRKAVSICFGSGAATEQRPAFLTPPSTAALHSPVSRASQPQDRGAYASQFQWADTSFSAGNTLVKMEDDHDLAGGAGSSSSSSITGGGGALSRTLLPIGQSRCIEYFQFL